MNTNKDVRISLGMRMAVTKRLEMSHYFAKLTNRELLKEERWYAKEINWMWEQATRPPYLYLGECAVLHLAEMHIAHVECKRELAKRGYIYVIPR